VHRAPPPFEGPPGSPQPWYALQALQAPVAKEWRQDIKELWFHRRANLNEITFRSRRRGGGLAWGSARVSHARTLSAITPL
jgi:hypothetical protein